MITNAVNDKRWQVASNASHLSSLAHTESETANPGGNNRAARVAMGLASTASGLAAADDLSSIYREMRLHDAAMRAHESAIDFHTNQDPIDGPSIPASPIEAHNEAYSSHWNAAQEGAKALGMSYNAHKAFRDAIQQNPEEPTNRLVYADFLEEHGLPKEANRLRLDPTGHIGRIVSAYTSGGGINAIAHSPRYAARIRRSIALSSRANRLGTMEAHLQAARSHNSIAQASADWAGNLSDHPLGRVFERIARAHARAAAYHFEKHQ